MTFKIEGLEVAASDDRHVVHRLADGSQLPITTPPMVGDMIPQPTHEAAQHVGAAASAFGKLEAARRAAASDPNLSEAGRKSKIEDVRKAALATLQAAEEAIDGMDNAAVGITAEAYAVPAIERDDLESVMLDQEIRAYAREVRGDSAALKAFSEALKSSPRHLEAIKRSPVPIRGVSEFADRLWNERLEGSPKAIRAQGYADAIAWGRQTLGSIKDKI